MCGGGWKLVSLSLLLLTTLGGTYLSIKQAPVQLPPGRLSAQQLGLSYRDITWKLSSACACACARP